MNYRKVLRGKYYTVLSHIGYNFCYNRRISIRQFNYYDACFDVVYQIFYLHVGLFIGYWVWALGYD